MTLLLDDVGVCAALQPWSWQAPEGFTLRGWRSRPSGRPMLHFIHGTGMCGLTYWPLLQQLRGQVDLFISDLHGHGDSDGVWPFVGWNRSAELARAAWQAHAADYPGVPVIAGGHSLGGVISAMMLGMQAQADMPVFQRGLLLDPVVMPPLMHATGRLGETLGLYQRHPMARRVAARRQSWPSAEAAADYLRNRGIFQGWSEASLWAYVQHALALQADGSVQLKCPPAIEGNIFGSLPRRLWPLLESIDVPVDVLMGRQTYPFALKAAARWQRRNRCVRVHHIAGDHCYMQDDPQGTAAVLAPLLAV
ncbi:hypothetical protein ABB30_10720 [Stenotrophomonas ginsengisoli]|uniref:AB hydrolase-1 domain-containing protein n=1 Tax=Stenotrophomonas ginsengisoli TaxID=336566 RepID=A0A0R0D1W6_9GAMM|nr:alpha/beta hydrolase [Stenotrophomonas ginsengisoli]KRG76025.1 hypothetical protein ABB30_10720 [Stenotrophomonas ginsengisoli]